jgi:hypothetical protein
MIIPWLVTLSLGVEDDHLETNVLSWISDVDPTDRQDVLRDP